MGSREEGRVISTTGRDAGRPREASLHAASMSSIFSSKWAVPKCCGPAWLPVCVTCVMRVRCVSGWV